MSKTHELKLQLDFGGVQVSNVDPVVRAFEAGGWKRTEGTVQ